MATSGEASRSCRSAAHGGPVVVGDREQRGVTGRALLRRATSDGRWWRRPPSKRAPMRRWRSRLRSLRASVARATRTTSQRSKAWVSSSSLASVLIGVRWASAASHVPPISTSSGSSRPRHRRSSMNRVQPTIRPSAMRRWANGTAVPASALGEQVGRRSAPSPSRPSGTSVKPYVDRSPAAASASAPTCSVSSGSSSTWRPWRRNGASAISDRRYPGRQTGGAADTTGGCSPPIRSSRPTPTGWTCSTIGSTGCVLPGSAADRLLIRGAIRDQKPPGIDVPDDPGAAVDAPHDRRARGGVPVAADHRRPTCCSRPTRTPCAQ